MNISDITHERLRIAINAIERDSTVASTVRMGFKTIYECMYQQKLSTEIIENQLNEKINANELGFMLNEKLSLNQFLRYFQKIERIVEGIENRAGVNEEELGRRMEEKFGQVERSLKHFQNEAEGKKKIKNSEIETIKKELHTIKQTIQQISFRTSLLKLPEKQNTNPFQTFGEPLQLNSTLNLEIKEDLKAIQQYYQESNKTLSILLEETNSQKYVSFDELRGIMSCLQNNLHDSIRQFVLESTQSPQKSLSGDCLKINWVSSEVPGRVIFQNLRNHGPMYQIDGSRSKILFIKPGIYQVTCAFFPIDQAQIIIKINNCVLAKHLCSDPPKNNLGRSIMLSARVCEQSCLTIICNSEESVQGAISVVHL